MCLILFAHRQHPEYPLVVIANRDEYYARPSRDAHWWDDAPIFAGRDLEAGGTWLGVDRRGRFAAVTNVREPGGMQPGPRSRGELPRDFLAGETDAEAYLDAVAARAPEYPGFNLLLGDAAALWFCSNRAHGRRRIDPGIYGISNGAFDEPWPKLASGKAELEQALGGEVDPDALTEILTDHRIADDDELPRTGVPLDVERMLSSRFIRSPAYGTRACTVVLFGADGGVLFREDNYIAAGHAGTRVEERFSVNRR